MQKHFMKLQADPLQCYIMTWGCHANFMWLADFSYSI